MIEVVLHPEFVGADRLDDRRRSLGVSRKKPGMSRWLIGSISGLIPALGAFRGAQKQVHGIGREQRVARHPGRGKPRHQVSRGQAAPRIVQRLLDALAELRGGRAGGLATLALGPVAGRGVEQHLRQPVVPEPLGDLGGGNS